MASSVPAPKGPRRLRQHRATCKPPFLRSSRPICHTSPPPSVTMGSLTIDATNAAITVTFNDDMDLTAN